MLAVQPTVRVARAAALALAAGLVLVALASTPGGAAEAPERFLLHFPDATLVHAPGEGELQITAQGNVLSYGGDWEVRALKPYLYQLRQASWEGFFWEVNTSRKQVVRVRGAAFGELGGEDERLDVGVEPVGDPESPARFLLHFDAAYLVHAPGEGRPQIVAEGNALAYGTSWRVAKLKPYLYHLRERHWKGFYWKVNTSREGLYRVEGGPFGELGGSSEELGGVRVETVASEAGAAARTDEEGSGGESDLVGALGREIGEELDEALGEEDAPAGRAEPAPRRGSGSDRPRAEPAPAEPPAPRAQPAPEPRTSPMPTPVGDAAPADFAGRWDSSFGELRLHQVEALVIGDYADEGVMLGRASGGCLAGVFTNGARNGIFRFRKEGDDRFEGQWAWHGESLGGSWSGRRESAHSPKRYHNFTRGDGTTQRIENDRSVFDGRYSSGFGEVALRSRDLFLMGDYAEKGILAGMWDGSSYVGRFTNGDRTGWFDFAFLSKTGRFREGSWGWIEGSGGGDWTLERTSEASPSLDNVHADVGCP